MSSSAASASTLRPIASISALLKWLRTATKYNTYTVFADAVEKLRADIETSLKTQDRAPPNHRVLFICPSNAALASQLKYTSGAQWALTDPNSVLRCVVQLPPLWPTIEPRYYQLRTLAASSGWVTVWASPTAFIIPPSSDALNAVNFSLGTAAALTSDVPFPSWGAVPPLLPALLPMPTLQQAMAELTPTFATWIQKLLSDTFAQPGSYTLIAPSDDAFSHLATVSNKTVPELLAKDLDRLRFYHVIPGLCDPLPADGAVVSYAAANGQLVTASNRKNVARFDAAEVTAVRTCANGILYVVDAVMLRGTSGPALRRFGNGPLGCPETSVL